MAVIEAIETLYLEADASSVTFSSLGSYEHLQLRFSTKTNEATYTDSTELRFNADSGTNYSLHYINANNTTAAAFKYTGQPEALLLHTGDVGDATSYGNAIVDILDYRNTNKNTTVLSVSGVVLTDNRLNINSSVWGNTAAVTAITLLPYNGTLLLRGSSFTLYGLASS